MEIKNLDCLTMGVGRISVNFSVIERLLAGLVGRLITEDQSIAPIVTSEVPFQGLLKMLDSLLIYKYDEEHDFRITGKELIKRLQNCEEKRNNYIHSCFTLDDTGSISKLKITARRNRGLNLALQPLHSEDLEEFVTEEKKLLSDIEKMYKDIFGENESLRV